MEADLWAVDSQGVMATFEWWIWIFGMEFNCIDSLDAVGGIDHVLMT